MGPALIEELCVRVGVIANIETSGHSVPTWISVASMPVASSMNGVVVTPPKMPLSLAGDVSVAFVSDDCRVRRRALPNVSPSVLTQDIYGRNVYTGRIPVDPTEFIDEDDEF